MSEAKEKESQLPRGAHPKYTCDLLWEEDCYPSVRASAELSEDLVIAMPMLLPPA